MNQASPAALSATASRFYVVAVEGGVHPLDEIIHAGLYAAAKAARDVSLSSGTSAAVWTSRDYRNQRRAVAFVTAGEDGKGGLAYHADEFEREVIAYDRTVR